jgi:hypothetical protein
MCCITKIVKGEWGNENSICKMENIIAFIKIEVSRPESQCDEQIRGINRGTAGRRAGWRGLKADDVGDSDAEERGEQHGGYEEDDD